MDILSLILYTLLIICSFLVVSSRNPIYSLFFLILVYCCASLILLLFGLDFWGLMVLTIYIGAIVVLFLFLIMMVNFKGIEFDKTTFLIIGVFILVLLFFELGYLLFFKTISYNSYSLTLNLNQFLFNDLNCFDEGLRILLVQKVGILIFKDYPIFLITSCLVLLVSMVGSIFLTNFNRGFSSRKQYNQLSRNNHLFHVYIY